MSKKRAGLYARVSTTDQDPEMQLDALREYAERRGLHIKEEYIDHGVSGSKDSRPALDRMMKDARQRKLDIVLVWKFDRFARSTRHLVSALEEFGELGVDFVSITEAIDTSTSVGKMIFTVISALAEFERTLIIERVRAGIARARVKGKKLGRPKLQVNEDRIRELRAEGLSLRQIAEHMGVSKSAVGRILKKAG